METLEKTLTSAGDENRAKDISLFFYFKKLVDGLNKENMKSLLEILKPCEGVNADKKSLFRRWGEVKESIQQKAMWFLKDLQLLKKEQIEKIVKGLDPKLLGELAELVGVNPPANIDAILAKITDDKSGVSPELKEKVDTFLKKQKPPLDEEMIRKIIGQMHDKYLEKLMEMVGDEKGSKDTIIQKLNAMPDSKKDDVYAFLKQHMPCGPSGPDGPDGPGGPDGPDRPEVPYSRYNFILQTFSDLNPLRDEIEFMPFHFLSTSISVFLKGFVQPFKPIVSKIRKL